jgi:hypothetical protein
MRMAGSETGFSSFVQFIFTTASEIIIITH